MMISRFRLCVRISWKRLIAGEILIGVYLDYQQKTVSITT